MKYFKNSLIFRYLRYLGVSTGFLTLFGVSNVLETDLKEKILNLKGGLPIDLNFSFDISSLLNEYDSNILLATNLSLEILSKLNSIQIDNEFISSYLKSNLPKLDDMALLFNEIKTECVGMNENMLGVFSIIENCFPKIQEQFQLFFNVFDFFSREEDFFKNSINQTNNLILSFFLEYRGIAHRMCCTFDQVNENNYNLFLQDWNQLYYNFKEKYDLIRIELIQNNDLFSLQIKDSVDISNTHVQKINDLFFDILKEKKHFELK